MRDGWELGETGSGGPKTRDRGEGLRKKVEKKEDSWRRGRIPYPASVAALEAREMNIEI